MIFSTGTFLDFIALPANMFNSAKYISKSFVHKARILKTIRQLYNTCHEVSIIDSNTYHVLVRSGPMLQDFVCGVYTRAAMVNHSCRPNTRPIFRGKTDRTMSVIAIEDIEAGEEITTSYLEPFYTTMQRRALLKRGKHFDCCCKRYNYHKINEIQHIRCFRLFCILRPTDYVD